MHGSKWFYERARGQYKNLQISSIGNSRKIFEAEFPKDQLVVKTDLSKYVLSFDRKPHIVSRHAQKCFLEFANVINDAWEKNRDQFNDAYFKEAMAKVLVFRWTDHMVGEADWYLEERGYKVQTVTYTLAWLVQALEQKGRYLNYQLIWNNQDLDDALKKVLRKSTPKIAKIIKNAPPHIKNVDEYCKREECWTRVVDEMDLELPAGIERYTVDQEVVRQDRRDALSVRRTDSEIELDVLILRLAPLSEKLLSIARSERLLSPKSEAAIKKMGTGRVTLSGGEKNALANLLSRLRQRGLEIE